MIKISTLKENPDNPRSISDENLEKLCKSIKKFPKMFEMRPIVVDENNIVLGGNMRLRALRKLNRKEIPDDWVKKVSDLTEKQKKQFLIKDNIEYGTWKEDLLQGDEWDDFDLKDWDLDLELNMWDNEDEDLSDKNKEIDLDSLGDEGIIKLKFNHDTYLDLIDRLSKLKKDNDTNESLFLKMLKSYESKT